MGKGQKSYILQGDEPAVAVIWAQALAASGQVRWRGTQCGTLINDDGERVGSFHRSTHGGWSVWTKAYAGWASREEVEILPCLAGAGCEFAFLHYEVTVRRCS